MTTIWKELLFLHGHFARLQDLLEEAPAATAARPATLPSPTARHGSVLASETAAGADGLACGGCS